MSMLKAPTRRTSEDDGTSTSKEQRTCAWCYSTYATFSVLALRRCEHVLCQGCLTSYFEFAVRNEVPFPASCCKMIIPLADAERLISKNLAKRYKMRMAEHTAEDKTYCHIQKCSTFVPAYSVFEKQAVCPKCLASTCLDCKMEWHEGPCIVTEDPLLVQLARLMKWTQCPHCKHLVGRTVGCNHMTCLCGHEFCYVCGAKYNECRCVPYTAAADEEEDDGCIGGFLLFD